MDQKKERGRPASSKFEALFLHIIRLLKSDVTDFCDLETTNDKTTIVAQDGSLATVLRFNGVKSLLGRDEYENYVWRFSETLSAFFNVPGYQLQVVFTRDMDVRPELNIVAQQQRATAERIGLDINDLIDEQLDRCVNYCHQEDCYLVFWTRPSLLSEFEIKRHIKETNDFRAKTDWPVARNAQNLLAPISTLLEQHATYVTKLAAELSSQQLGCSVEVLEVGEALRAIKKSVYPDEVGNDWQASYPGQPIPFRWKTNDDPTDKSNLLYPPLPAQIMTSSAEIGGRGSILPDPTTVRVGSRVYAPLSMLVPPQDPKYFGELFAALNMVSTREQGRFRAMPWSVSFMLASDGLSGLMLRKLGSSLAIFSPTNNKAINGALNALTDYKNNGGCVVKLRLTAMTWSSNLTAESIAELDLRKRQLRKALEGWGNMTVSEKDGNPMIPFQSCAVGLTTQHVGTPCPAPIDDAVRMLPLTRPASPFDPKQCSVFFRSQDGKALLFPRFSQEQTTWITLIAGRPGSGKSVTLNYLNLQSCVNPGLNQLPYMAIIDIGISSEGVINVIRDALPENMRHLAVYKRLQNSREYCINVLDTPLGQRKPLPKDRQFMQNFVTMLVTPPERKGNAYEHMSSFVGRVIDKAFELKMDNREGSDPILYHTHSAPSVDRALQEVGFHPSEIITWWEIVDTLFKADRLYEAEIAQRYAVPTLPDLSAAAMTLKDEYDELRIDGMSVITIFTIGISEAMGDFPIFSQQTRFDIGSARVIALDLQEVAQGVGTEADHKRISLMYMAARQCFMKKIAFAHEEIDFIEPLYREHFHRIADELVDEKKSLVADEYHRTGKQPILDGQFLTDGREGRKWKLEICLSSQRLDDFSEGLREIATTVLVFSGADLNKLKDISDIERANYDRHVTGPSLHGTTFLCRVDTISGKYSQLFTLTLGAKTLWALSTTAEDRKLRSLLYAALPGAQARAALARHFPSGSARSRIEALRKASKAPSQLAFLNDDQPDEITKGIADAIIEEELGGAFFTQRPGAA
ncbi:MAG: type IV secretion protein DotO [Betaproteobacteria bacterium]|nr:type IV secretion protein DotO [Betaproteobacteria bacterium]